MSISHPRIKEAHNPCRVTPERIRIGTFQFGVGSEIADDGDGNIWRLLTLMDGSRTVDDVVVEMCWKDRALDEQSVREAIERLVEHGFIEDAAAKPPLAFSPGEIERYSRNANYFSWVDTQPRTSRYELQARLRSSSVTLIGLGGAGSAVALGLVSAGIGRLHCVDCDQVDDSNLNRQVLYTEADVGRSKVDVGTERLREANRYVEITGTEREIDSADAARELLRDCDLAVLCADQPTPHRIMTWTNAAALATGTPWVTASYAGPMIVVGLFVPDETPCYLCLDHAARSRPGIDHPDDGEYLYSGPAVNAVIAPSAMLTGSLGALEAISFLTGLTPSTRGRVFHQNLMVCDHTYYIEGPHWHDCPACGLGASGAARSRPRRASAF
jgi:molybdopterin/thiamine biosynthesis adenylyltransferase